VEPAREAAWVLRAVILLQPFPDGNHRVGVLAAEVMIERRGLRLRPSPDAGAAFQKEVPSRRRRLLGGFQDAPLSTLADWDDEVMACCEEFIKAGLRERLS
jgi:hypothetical protein